MAGGGRAKGKQKLCKSDYRELLESGSDFANAFQGAKGGVAEAEGVYSDIRRMENVATLPQLKAAMMRHAYWGDE